MNSRKEKKALSQINTTIDAVAKSLKKLKKGNAHLTYIIYNATLYYLLAMRDIQIVKIDAIAHKDASVRKLSIRIITLTVGELDISKVTGKCFNEALKELKISDDLVDEVHRSLRSLRKAQQKAQNNYKELRTNVIAHRDKDSLRQYELIEKIDEQLILKLGFDFFEEMKVVSNLLTKCFIASSNMNSLIIQAVKNMEDQ